MAIAVPKDRRFTVEEYIKWALAQPQGRFELVDGEVIAMAPERARHNLVKAEAYVSLRDAIRKAGLPCTAYTDGMTVRIDDYTAREPDALVQCGKPIDGDALVADAPVIVVEVVSPSSERDDTMKKFSEYFSVESIQHYLIIDPDKRIIIHARRSGDEIASRIIHDGEIRMDPPNLSVTFADLMPEPD